MPRWVPDVGSNATGATRRVVVRSHIWCAPWRWFSGVDAASQGSTYVHRGIQRHPRRWTGWLRGTRFLARPAPAKDYISSLSHPHSIVWSQIPLCIDSMRNLSISSISGFFGTTSSEIARSHFWGKLVFTIFQSIIPAPSYKNYN